MAAPVSILPPPPIPKPRRAKKPKWCADCAGRIPAGTVYLEWNAWRWTHLKACPGVAEAVR